MTALGFICSIISLLLAITPRFFPYVAKGRDKLNERFISLCCTLDALDDDRLVIALKPITVVSAIVILALTLALSKIWGPDDQDARQLSFLFLSFLIFNGLVLNDREEFQNRIQGLCLKLTSIAKWSSYVCAIMLALWLVFISNQIGYTPTETDIMGAFSEIFKPLLGALSIMAIILLFGVILIPMVIKRAFIHIMRWIIKNTITRFDDNPIQVPFWIASAIFLSFNIIPYLAGK